MCFRWLWIQISPKKAEFKKYVDRINFSESRAVDRINFSESRAAALFFSEDDEPEVMMQACLHIMAPSDAHHRVRSTR